MVSIGRMMLLESLFMALIIFDFFLLRSSSPSRRRSIFETSIWFDVIFSSNYVISHSIFFSPQTKIDLLYLVTSIDVWSIYSAIFFYGSSKLSYRMAAACLRRFFYCLFIYGILSRWMRCLWIFRRSTMQLNVKNFACNVKMVWCEIFRSIFHSLPCCMYIFFGRVHGDFAIQ